MVHSAQFKPDDYKIYPSGDEGEKYSFMHKTVGMPLFSALEGPDLISSVAKRS